MYFAFKYISRKERQKVNAEFAKKKILKQIVNLKDYIQGKRHGKEANELERKALNDAFLQDALSGFDAVQGEHVPVIEELEKRISTPKTLKKITPFWRWAVAVVAFLLIGTSLLEFLNYNNKNLPQVASVKPNNEFRTDKPKDSVIVADNIEIESSRKNRTIINKTSTSTKNTAIPASVAVNDTFAEVQVTGYSTKEVSTSGYTSLANISKYKELSYGNRLDTSNGLIGENNASNSEFDKNLSQGKIAGVNVQNLDDTFWLKNESTKINPTLSKEIAKNENVINEKTETALQGKVSGLAVKKNQNNTRYYGSNSANTSEKIKIRGASSIKNTNITPSKITKGRILDENGEPLIGASVIIKGTSKGVSTNFDGNFTLPVVDADKDSLLVVSYVGYEKQEIPIEQNIGEVKLLADNKSLNEVVVIGYGVQKKSAMTGSVSSISKRSAKKHVFNKKEFINYFKQNYDRNVCSGQKIRIIATFKLDEIGHPTDVLIVESNCSEMDVELKKWLEKSPNWTKKNKEITLKILLSD